MYPLGRLIKEMVLQRNAPRIGMLETHRSSHLCWPWDLDPWMELNNGRTLTLYDLGRLPMMLRNGLIEALRKSKCGITVAGASVRYRKRIRVFQRVEMLTRIIGWDARFFYMEQGLWCGTSCANHILLRLAVTSSKLGGIVPPAQLLQYFPNETPAESPALPQWVQAWIDSESDRPWPPTMV